jgi:hypothetical protein
VTSIIKLPTYETTKDLIIPGIAVLGGLIGGAITIYIYYRNSKLRRAEWLYLLFEKFFYQSSYGEIRRLLDYGSEDDLNRLRDALKSHSEVSIEERLVDYLNFFQFIANLRQLGQLTIDEIQMMFDYYIAQLGRYDFILGYLENQDFGVNLSQLIREVRGRRETK